MEIQYLRTVLAVLQSKSFSRAAAALGVTQSAVSHRVKYLEDHYGCKLLDRSGAEIVPTEAGQRLLKKAEQIISLEDELEKDLSETGMSRKFSICSTVAFGITHMSEIISKFCIYRSEGVDLKILLQTPSQLLEVLRSGSYDIGVIEHNDGIDFSGLKTIALPDDELVFISNCQVELDSQMSPLSWLLEHCIITRVEGCSCRDVLADNLQKCSLGLTDFKNSVVCDDLRVTIDSVLAGAGIAFISRALVKDYIQKGLLYESKVDGFQHRRKVTVVMKPDKSSDENVQLFLSTLLEHMANPKPMG